MSRYDKAELALRSPVATNPEILEFVRFATLAPSGHNTQPWYFAVRETGIGIFPDISRRTPVVDPDDHHLFVSLGCAAENFLIAAAAQRQMDDRVKSVSTAKHRTPSVSISLTTRRRVSRR